MGIVIPEQTQRSGPDPREPLYSAVAVAHDWFARQLSELPEAETARAYLQSRGLDMDTAGSLALGYAPRGNGLPRGHERNWGSRSRCCSRPGCWRSATTAACTPGSAAGCCFRSTTSGDAWSDSAGGCWARVSPSTSTRPRPRSSTRARQLYNLHQARKAIRKEEASSWSRATSMCCGWCWPASSTWSPRSAPP